MKDGGRYEGEFFEGEISGKGERIWTDGTVYKGEFQNGEKHGYGEITYGNSCESYKGNWELNIRSGQGTYVSKGKNTFTVTE